MKIFSSLSSMITSEVYGFNLVDLSLMLMTILFITDAKVMKNREKHRKLASLYGDSREVEAMFEDVSDMLEFLSSRKEHPNGLLKNYFDAFKLSQTFKQELSIYKQVKFWQIINSHSKISKSDNTAQKPVGHVNPSGQASISQQIKKKIVILQKDRLKNLNIESSEWPPGKKIQHPIVSY
ncbi:hypothetical protein PGT21_034369 [Puccinia graminis f. sp. tritici]|uniref:Uncharacterized protein n=1 Tax=Puccinia graminis f. sp. tritici TaxID=56615 RepID=A0A5B0MWG3_PUCGR|nr:hypothetical protein PGT21_034369 [Puccinia graminis f. sp. tritici]KAA1092020.1 hypothetical protein PGTUg99_015187 [Puccinia graminis f. sp. tritici]